MPNVQCLEGTDPGGPDLPEARDNACAAVIDSTVYVVGSRSCSLCPGGGGSKQADTVLAPRSGGCSHPPRPRTGCRRAAVIPDSDASLARRAPAATRVGQTSHDQTAPRAAKTAEIPRRGRELPSRCLRSRRPGSYASMTNRADRPSLRGRDDALAERVVVGVSVFRFKLSGRPVVRA